MAAKILPKRAEKRRFVRYALTGEIPATLTNEGNEAFEVVSVDVSKNGLGLLVQPSPKVGEVVALTFTGKKPLVLRFEVRWAMVQHQFKDIPELKDMCRCGLFLLTQGVDLLAVLSAFDGVTIEE